MKIKLPPHIGSLEAYKPGKPIADVIAEHGLPDAIKLASNENPLGASPKGIRAAQEALVSLQHYPNGGKSIREAIAVKYGLTADRVIAGSGSEGVMNTVMRTFLVQGDEVLTSEGTFTGFYVLANAIGLKLVTVPMKNFGYDLEALASNITSKTKLIYIANPNNPTGSVVGRKAFEAFYEQVPPNVIILHDEAYYDFAMGDVPDHYTTLTDSHSNIVTLRTFSKSHGLAGIRIGFGTAQSELIAAMLKVKLPFEPSSPAQAAGIAALEDEEFLQRTIETNQAGKQYLSKALHKLGMPYVETAANFFFIPFDSMPIGAAPFVLEMERRGIIVRPVHGYGISNAVRISIGTPEENARAVSAMEEIFSAARRFKIDPVLEV
ncbi:MAG TPA: histidinol-phosphate transaminase [Candidatus Kapabacteria bacterium]|jgi:histidinol-phosphate aminotransferase|nr:histidinol-phosphate transaminase [Candidatus Kapabacteria bacterium]